MYNDVETGWRCVKTKTIGAHRIDLVSYSVDGCLLFAICVDCIRQFYGTEIGCAAKWRAWVRALNAIANA